MEAFSDKFTYSLCYYLRNIYNYADLQGRAFKSRYSYFFYNEWIYLTRENNWASYLLTAFARYSTDGTYDWWYKSQIRYTVATDTFTALSVENTSSINNPRPIPSDDDMWLYSAWSETSMTTRVSLFTYIGS